MRLKKIISSSLIIGLLFNSGLASFAGIISEDGRYETFKDNSITIENILEEDKIDIEVKGNTLVNLMNDKDIYYPINGWTWLDDGYLRKYNTSFYLDFIQLDLSMYKPNTTYTFIIDIKENNSTRDIVLPALDQRTIISSISTTKANSIGRTVGTFTTMSDFTGKAFGFYINSNGVMDGSITIRLQIFEGDLTDNPPAGYVKGLQSSFQSQLITQEMISSGQEKVENLGKYKVEIKSINKNLLPNNFINETGKGSSNASGWLYPDMFNKSNNRLRSANLIPVKPKTQYTINCTDIFDFAIIEFDTSKRQIIDTGWILNKNNKTYTTSGACAYIVLIIRKTGVAWDDGSYLLPEEALDKIQLEEGSIATEYETCRESINTFYLNTPLLEGDTIECINGQATHVKRYSQVVLDGDNETWKDNGTPRDNFITYYIKLDNNTKFGATIFNDRLRWYDTEMFNKMALFTVKSFNNLYFCYDTSLGTSVSKWLRENPITVVYELNEPIYEPIKADLSVQLFKGTTHIFNNSDIPANMTVTVDRVANKAKETTELAKSNPTVENLSQARYWSNLMKESTLKDGFQNEINNITEIENLNIEKKTSTANLDLYVKSNNSLTMSLSTNSVTFESYSGVEDLEILDAVNITINSSLPYSLNAYMSVPISNADGSNQMDANILNIRDNTERNYSQFINTTDKIVLKDDCVAGNNNIHGIDLKLSGNNLHKADVYKTVIKFEAEQK